METDTELWEQWMAMAMKSAAAARLDEASGYLRRR